MPMPKTLKWNKVKRMKGKMKNERYKITENRNMNNTFFGNNIKGRKVKNK